MYLTSKFQSQKSLYLSLLLALMPLSFIAGNMIININLILLTVSSLIIFGKNIFKVKYYLIDKLLIFFFSFLLFTALFNDLSTLNKLTWREPRFATTIYSLLFLKYLVFYLVLRFLVEKDIINFKYFFVSCSLATLFVCFDIFLQFIVGKDIFGYEVKSGLRKLSGPFGDEMIAGGYIQRFSIFTFFTIPLFYKNFSANILKVLIPVLLVIIFLALILSGNRMPLLLFILLVVLVGIFHRQTSKYLIPFIFTFSILFLLVFNFNQKVKDNFENFYGQVSVITKSVLNKDISDNSSQYLKEFATFYDTWLLNKYVGGGIKSFRYYCHVRPNINKNSDFICNMHPHNYYLEILTETGIIGFLISISIFALIINLTLFKKYFTKSSFLKDNKIVIPFIFLFIVEIFPIKSTGSFFTTGNSTFIFMIIAVLIGLVRKEKLIEN